MANKKDVDLKLVEDLAALLCTQVEICKIIGITDRTLRNRADISDSYKKGLESGKLSLRRIQFKLAEKSPAMAIWLGKNYLGQTDHFSRDNNEPIDLSEFAKAMMATTERRK